MSDTQIRTVGTIIDDSDIDWEYEISAGDVLDRIADRGCSWTDEPYIAPNQRNQECIDNADDDIPF